MKESGERDEGPNCSKSLRGRRSAKEPETSPAERVLRITPVSKEPHATREQGPCNHRFTVLIFTHLPKQEKSPGSVYAAPGGVRVLHVKYNWPRSRPRALRGDRQCYRRHRSKERRESRNEETQESLDYGRWPW